jgi:hypothetical protein
LVPRVSHAPRKVQFLLPATRALLTALIPLVSVLVLERKSALEDAWVEVTAIMVSALALEASRVRIVPSMLN